jgi:hypothetical protein
MPRNGFGNWAKHRGSGQCAFGVTIAGDRAVLRANFERDPEQFLNALAPINAAGDNLMHRSHGNSHFEPHMRKFLSEVQIAKRVAALHSELKDSDICS